MISKIALTAVLAVSTFQWTFASAADDVGLAFFNVILEDSVGNGSSSIGTYDPQLFSIEDAEKELVLEWEESFSNYEPAERCGYTITRGVPENENLLEQLIKDEDIYMEDALSNIFFSALFGRYTPVSIEYMVSVVWDGKSGDSEYCSVFKFEMLTSNGQRLYIDAQNID